MFIRKCHIYSSRVCILFDKKDWWLKTSSNATMYIIWIVLMYDRSLSLKVLYTFYYLYIFWLNRIPCVCDLIFLNIKRKIIEYCLMTWIEILILPYNFFCMTRKICFLFIYIVMLVIWRFLSSVYYCRKEETRKTSRP